MRKTGRGLCGSLHRCQQVNWLLKVQAPSPSQYLYVDGQKGSKFYPIIVHDKVVCIYQCFWLNKWILGKCCWVII